MALAAYLELIETRAQSLAMLLVLGFVVGEFLARGPFSTLLRRGQQLMGTLGRKLNREHRSVATLVYRGIVAVLMLLAPAIVAASLLTRPLAWVELLSALWLVAWFGHCFQTVATWRLAARAKHAGLALEIPGLDYLFSDSHAVIRYLIARRVDAFAIGIVGGCFWYVAGGPVAMAIYLVLAAACRTYRAHVAFGWAARSLFALADSLPKLIARALLFLAAYVTPHTKPCSGLRARDWLTAVAATLDIALGGKTPEGEIAWAGTASARLTHAHLARAIQLLVAASVWLLLLLAHQHLYNILIKLI
jgi:hypothetical protein